MAPSPTGDLHVGGAATFLVAWLEARSRGGSLVLRIEDLDPPRVVVGAETAIARDLAWLGLDWDEGPDHGPFAPYRQSERGALYEAALEQLARLDATYLCDCSRAEIARVASAPHAGDDGPRYPGTCRPFGMAPRAFRRPPAVRFRVPEGRVVSFVDGVHGPLHDEVSATTGDFVLRRGDGVFAYQLAVVVDDLAMQIDQVVRGADLLASTARQLLLVEALGGRAPAYVHAPLWLGPDGQRLAKRARGVPVRDHRDAGRSPAQVVGAIAHALGLTPDDAPATPTDLLASYATRRLVHDAITTPSGLTLPT
jgi:glutamyl-tRNA synthetase